MDLDGAVEFFNEYLDAIHQQAVAVRTEPDDMLKERRTLTRASSTPRRGPG